jgi:putative ABC transport system permease protein
VTVVCVVCFRRAQAKQAPLSSGGARCPRFSSLGHDFSMILLPTMRVAARALRRNTLRTLLTMLGIIIGVGAVIAMVSIGNGAKAQVEAQIASLGQNVILIMSGSFSRGGVRSGWGSSGTLTVEDYDALRREIPGVSGASPEVRTFAQVAYGNQNANTTVMGVGADYVDIRAWSIASGANFSDQDVRTANKVALLGRTTAETLFGDSDPIGQVIRIKNAPFIVVGMLAPKGMSLMGSDQDDVILVPYTSAMKRLTGQTSFRSLNVQAEGPRQLSEVQEQIIGLLRQRHRIGPDREDDFMVRTQEEIAEMATATSRIMTVLLGSIAGVSLLVGGIGIMNIMLVSVTERTRVIGIRMSVGARSMDILLQFLIEAVTLSVVGGLIGIALGLGTSRLLTAKMGWATYVSADSILLAFAFSAAIGIFFGFYPARKAAQLDPIEALHYE